MEIHRKRLVILNAEDDPDDQFLFDRALEKIGLEAQLIFVNDGEQLLDYLHRRSPFTNPIAYPRPDIIFIDLRMPRIDGHSAIETIKTDADLCDIPLVAISTSNDPDDADYSRRIGAAAFIPKGTIDDLGRRIATAVQEASIL